MLLLEFNHTVFDRIFVFWNLLRSYSLAYHVRLVNTEKHFKHFLNKKKLSMEKIYGNSLPLKKKAAWPSCKTSDEDTSSLGMWTCWVSHVIEQGGEWLFWKSDGVPVSPPWTSDTCCLIAINSYGRFKSIAGFKQFWRHKDLRWMPFSKWLLITICIVLRMGRTESYQTLTMKPWISHQLPIMQHRGPTSSLTCSLGGCLPLRFDLLLYFKRWIYFQN